LSREKGCDVFLQAMAAVRDLPITACIIGEGRERSALERTSREIGVSDRVHWAGAVGGAFEVFPAFDALALSSRTEGTPIVLFEAMNAEVPIIATSVGGVPDVLSPSEAWLTPPERPDLFADALRSLQENPAIGTSRARAARQKLGDAYTVAPWIEAYDRVYRHVIDAHR
jgi:glycosyltransferase involved in cell wall biosynthesis